MDKFLFRLDSRFWTVTFYELGARFMAYKLRLILQCWCNHNLINHFMAKKPFRIIQFEWSSVTFKMSFWISRQLPRLEKNSKCSNLYIRLLRHNKRSIVSENTFSCEYMSKFPKCSNLKLELAKFYILYLRFGRHFQHVS